MKTVRLFIPVIAFLFAVVAAFATSTERHTNVKAVAVNVRNFNADCNLKTGQCSNTGGPQCSASAGDDLRLDAGTTCGDIATGIYE